MQIIRNLVGVFKWFLLHGELHSRSFEISLNRTYSNAVVINDFVLEKCCVAWSDQWRTFSLVLRGLLFRMELLRTRKLTLKDTVIPKRDIWILFFAWNERNVDISIIPGFFVQRSFKILRVVQMKYFVSPSALCSSRRRFKPLSCQKFPLVPLYHVSLFSGTGSRYAFCLFRFVGLAKNAMSEFQEKNNEQQEGRSHPVFWNAFVCLLDSVIARSHRSCQDTRENRSRWLRLKKPHDCFRAVLIFYHEKRERYGRLAFVEATFTRRLV